MTVRVHVLLLIFPSQQFAHRNVVTPLVRPPANAAMEIVSFATTTIPKNARCAGIWASANGAIFSVWKSVPVTHSNTRIVDAFRRNNVRRCRNRYRWIWNGSCRHCRTYHSRMSACSIVRRLIMRTAKVVIATAKYASANAKRNARAALLTVLRTRNGIAVAATSKERWPFKFAVRVDVSIKIPNFRFLSFIQP